MTGCTAMGTTASGTRLERVKSSPQYDEDRFVNPLPREDPAILPTLIEWVAGGSEYSSPNTPPPIVERAASHFERSPASGLRITWLGHSTLLVEIDGKRVLFDPVWSERSSPFSWAGPKRFHKPPLAFEELPAIDVVAISHDHYDHLDHQTILRLAEKDVQFVVPLGVGAHLAYWGIAPERISELDWWETHKIGELTMVATPARHFSGRSLVMADRDRTLWSGWAILGPQHRVYYSGDTAMFPGFSEIGRRLGPFDATMIESGAYNARWADVHLGPEQAVQAHRMVQGKVMIPVHWGTFDLALHAWTEPAERVIAAARRMDVTVAVPQFGASVEPDAPPALERWWPNLSHQTAVEHPVISSGLDEGLQQTIRTLVTATP
jgi:L-ascorbate metabolism protein UlaG (beta-lactamase superfamily)